MKQFTQILTLVLLFLVSTSCTHKGHLGRIDIVFLLDNSDANRIIPDANSVIKLYDYNTQKLCYAAYFKQTYINDFLNNGVTEYDIPNQKEGEKENLLDDPQFRKKMVLDFRQKVFRKIQEQSLSNFSQRPESKVYETICSEIEELAKRESFRKYLIISSDLTENSKIFNAYAPSFLRILEEDRIKAKQKIRELFLEEHSLPKDLSGIVIYVLFEPKTQEEDKRFSFFREVYRELLEQRGAKVYFKSSNIIKKYCNE